jgi:hypothetical protein
MVPTFSFTRGPRIRISHRAAHLALGNAVAIDRRCSGDKLNGRRTALRADPFFLVVIGDSLGDIRGLLVIG